MIPIIVISSCLCILSLPNSCASESDLILIHVVSSFLNRRQLTAHTLYAGRYAPVSGVPAALAPHRSRGQCSLKAHPHDYTISTLDVLQVCDACTDMGMTYSVIMQCTDCVVFPAHLWSSNHFLNMLRDEDSTTNVYNLPINSPLYVWRNIVEVAICSYGLSTWYDVHVSCSHHHHPVKNDLCWHCQNISLSRKPN